MPNPISKTWVYFGPTIKGFGLSHGQRTLGFSPNVQRLIDKEPGFRNLFVSSERFAQVKHELKNVNSPSAQIVKHFQNRFNRPKIVNRAPKVGARVLRVKRR